MNISKFFPVELMLPKIDEEALHGLFQIRLDALRGKYSRTAGEDEKPIREAWQQLWIAAGKKHFTTLRRLSAFFKSLKSAAQSIAAEVNFLDLSGWKPCVKSTPSYLSSFTRTANCFTSRVGECRCGKNG